MLNSRARAWTASGTVLLILLVLGPVLFIMQMSVRSGVEAFRMPPTLVFSPTLQNYIALLEGKFVRSLMNSTVTATSTTVLALLLGVPAAYAFSRARVRAQGLVSLWTLTTRMAPPIAFGIPFFLIYKDLGLIDTRIGLVLIYLTFNLSLVIWMMRAFFWRKRRTSTAPASPRPFSGSPCLCRRPASPPPRSSPSFWHGTTSSTRCCSRAAKRSPPPWPS